MTRVLAVWTACLLGLGLVRADDGYLKGVTDGDPLAYAVGDEMRFSFELAGEKAVLPPGEWFLKWTRTGDDGVKLDGREPFAATRSVMVKTTSAKAGFVRLQAQVVDVAGRPCGKLKFDMSAGADVAALRGVPAPDDFAAFWARRRARLDRVPLTVVRKEVPSADRQVRIWEVSVTCAGPRPVTGYLTVPADASAVRRYPVLVHYSFPCAKDVLRAPSGGPHDHIRFGVSLHGFELGREDAYYDEARKSIDFGRTMFGFCDAQNADPEAAYFSGLSYRVMRALDFAKSLPEWNGVDLWSRGGSCGGLQSFWAAALEPKLTRCESGITWCCDLGGVTMGRLGGWRPNWVAALGYFDPVNLAALVRPTCEVRLTAGLGDYVCPPSGLCVLWNNLSVPHKSLVWTQGGGHGSVPPDPQRITWRQP